MLSQAVSRLVLVAAVLVAVGLAATAQEGEPKGSASATGAAALLAAQRLSPERQLTTQATFDGENWWRPAVAYNHRHGTYLMVTHNDWAGGRAVYASLLNRDGTVEVISYIATYMGKDAVQPAVAYNYTTDQWIVVWAFNENGDGGTYEVWGVILNSDLSDRTDDFHVFSWPNRSMYSPKVAWNSLRNEYLVIWNSFNTSGGLPGVPNDIAGARVSATGSVLAAPLIFTTSTYPHQADLVYNVATDEYFVVFVRSYTEGTTGNDIYGMRVSWNGSVVNPPGVIQIASDQKHENAPAVATNGQHRYVVVWEHEYSASDRDIKRMELDATGASVGGSNWVALTYDDERAPDVAAQFGGDVDYVVAWQRETAAGTNIEGTRWDRGTPSEVVEVAGAAFWDHEAPALVWGSPGTLIAYEGDASGDPSQLRHIYGRLWKAHSVFLPAILRGQ